MDESGGTCLKFGRMNVTSQRLCPWQVRKHSIHQVALGHLAEAFREGFKSHPDMKRMSLTKLSQRPDDHINAS